jgi:hypothetical protein
VFERQESSLTIKNFAYLDDLNRTMPNRNRGTK